MRRFLKAILMQLDRVVVISSIKNLVLPSLQRRLLILEQCSTQRLFQVRSLIKSQSECQKD